MNLTRSRFLRHLAFGLAATLMFGACNGGGETTSSEGGEPLLVVGTEPAFAPFEFQDENGEIVGFDIDLMNAIAQAEGFKVRFDSLPFDGLIPALQGGTIDAAISGMTITAERENTVDFTRPYFKAGLAIAVQGNDEQTKNLDDLEGKRIAVAIGTTGAQTAQGISQARVSTFDNSALALQELSNGNADAVINDAPVTLRAIAVGNIRNVKVVGELLTEEYYGIATPDGSESRELINSGLATIIENGTYAEIYKKWFGEDATPPELPADYQPPSE